VNYVARQITIMTAAKKASVRRPAPILAPITRSIDHHLLDSTNPSRSDALHFEGFKTAKRVMIDMTQSFSIEAVAEATTQLKASSTSS
jgi:hypothetical protein